jgi:hypothetical protein
MAIGDGNRLLAYQDGNIADEDCVEGVPMYDIIYGHLKMTMDRR